MTYYKTEFPDYKSTIPEALLAAPWQDASWHNDACPCFSRRMGAPEWDKQVHVYVDEADPTLREVDLPRYSVRITDEEGTYTDDDSLDFSSDSLADVLDRVGFLVGEVAR